MKMRSDDVALDEEGNAMSDEKKDGGKDQVRTGLERSRAHRGLLFLSREHNGSEDGDEDEDACHLKGKKEITRRGPGFISAILLTALVKVTGEIGYQS